MVQDSGMPSPAGSIVGDPSEEPVVEGSPDHDDDLDD
jgi:hypothetical protein